jgi:hypothetical protein
VVHDGLRLDWQDKKKVIEMCAFVWPFKKTTNLWVDLGFDWQPEGTTGDGRCGERCGQGRQDPITKRFRHFMALAVDPQRGPRGTNAVKMTCGIPEKLIIELLKAVNEVETIEDKVVLDLCAGFQSLREQVTKMGAKYVAVDVMGARKVKDDEARQAAVVLRQGNKYLSILQENGQGELQWMLPSGQHRKSDSSLHSVGVRELHDKVGLGESTWGSWVIAGPGTNALKHKTYYTYDITHSVPQADIETAFGGRGQKRQVRAWRWQTAAEILQSNDWGQEDKDFIRKQ